MRAPIRIVLLWAGVALVVVACFLVPSSLNSGGYVASVLLTNGCLLHVERVSYGIHHTVGGQFRFLAPLSLVIPESIRGVLWPRPFREMTLHRPGLAVWLTATDPKTGTGVRVHGVTCHFVDSQGNRYANEEGGSGSGSGFWWSSHAFPSYPRTERELTLCIRDEDEREYRVRFPNPHVSRPIVRSGRPLPQSERIGEMEIRLVCLVPKTNFFGVIPEHTWDPTWELFSQGRPAPGWAEPEWNMEDLVGNRSRFLDVHQSVLRVEAVVYPAVTNQEATVVLTNFPRLHLSELRTNLLWNSTVQLERPSVVLGLFSAGMHLFSNGVYQAAAPAWWTPQAGGAGSEFSCQWRRTLTAEERWLGHATDGPVVYVRGAWSEKSTRLGVRARDGRGRLWSVKQIMPMFPGPRDDRREAITGYLLDVPPEAGPVDIEILALRPVDAAFDVKPTLTAQNAASK